MYNNDSNSLDTGAPDIRLSGNQRMASQPDPTAEMNDFSMQVFGKPLHQLTPPQLDALYELMNEQSKAPKQNLGIMAAAPGTYSQRRKQMMAGGGIAGLKQIGKPGGLVEPGISKYGVLDFITDPIRSVYDKVVDDIIPNELKSPAGAALAGGALLNQFGIPDFVPGVGGMGQNWLGELLGRDAVLGDTGIFEAGSDLPDLINFMPGGSYPEGDNTTSNILQDLATNYLRNQFASGQGSAPTGLENLLSSFNMGNIFGTGSEDQPTGSLPYGLSGFGLGNINLSPYLKQVVKEKMEAVPATQGRMVGDPDRQVYVPGTPAIPGSPEESRRAVNPLYPIAAGIGVGKYVEGLPKDTLPADATSIDPAAIATAARGTDAEGAAAGLRFLPEQVTRAASGGRIGYSLGKGVTPSKPKTSSKEKLKIILENLQKGLPSLENIKKNIPSEILEGPGMQEGGLMNLGGMEKDYRQEGGFVPIGGKEKADDVPARLSKNEFVFTADAVRAAGGGDIDEGAAVMERLMENLEAGGKVSEESQGLEGARGMFANAQKLQNRII